MDLKFELKLCEFIIFLADMFGMPQDEVVKPGTLTRDKAGNYYNGAIQHRACQCLEFLRNKNFLPLKKLIK